MFVFCVRVGFLPWLLVTVKWFDSDFVVWLVVFCDSFENQWSLPLSFVVYYVPFFSHSEANSNLHVNEEVSNHMFAIHVNQLGLKGWTSSNEP